MNQINIFQNSQKILNIISKNLVIKSDHIYPLSVVYLWPTKYCPVGCSHCMFASPKVRQIDKQMILQKQAIDNFIKISYEAKLKSLIISGGGEPMLEFPNVIRLIKEAHFDYFELITSAYWSSNIFLIEKILNQIQEALSIKKDRNESFNFNLRISIDKFHQKVIKIKWLANLVNILIKDSELPINKRKYPDINIYFRSILIEDDTAEQLALSLQAKLTPMKNYLRFIVFTNKTGEQKKIPIYYKSVYFVGRASNIIVKKIVNFDQYFNSYSDENNDIRLGMTYLGPNSTGTILDGLNVTVTYEGKIMPYGGVSDVFGNLYKDNSYQDILNKLFGNIISRTLLLKGLNYIKKIAQEVEPNLDKIIKKKNWFASIADESLSTPEIKLYVTLRLIQKNIHLCEIKEEYIPDYLKKYINDQSYLQKKYYQYIHDSKIGHYSYPNEMIKTIRKRNNNDSSP